MIRRLTPLFSLLLAFGCGSTTAVVDRFEFGEPFPLAVGQQAVSADGSAAVHFTRVVTDSRCPADAVCVWAGEAIIELRVTRLGIGGVAGALADARAELPADSATPKLSTTDPRFEVKIGAAEPVVTNGLSVRALDLTRHSTSPGALVVPTAQLRVDTFP